MPICTYLQYSQFSVFLANEIWVRQYNIDIDYDGKVVNWLVWDPSWFQT